jgi:AcrR family transcriptional regulator
VGRAANDDTRERIVEAAMEAFARRGYRGTSLDSIAAEVGITRQGLLHHFPTKTRLLLAVLQWRDDNERRRATGDPQGAGSALRDGLEALLRRQREEPLLSQFFLTVSAESTEPGHPAHEFVRDRYAETRSVFAALVEREQDAGRIRTDVDARAIGVAVPALLDGLMLQRLLDPGVDVEAVFLAVMDALGAAESGAH